MTNKILIYSHLTTCRLQYTFSFFFEEFLGLNYKLTTDLEYFEQTKQPKFIYANDRISSKAHFLKAHSLLFEQEIKEISIDYFEYEECPAFFQSTDDSFFPFDIFAASFYLLSRYEEYLSFKADKFGRFPASESIAFKHDFLEQPIIDEWAMKLKTKLLEHYPELKFKKRSFRFLSTIDVDNAYAHLHKGFIRTFLALIQTGIKKPSNLVEKIRVLLKMDKDPYDSFDFLNKVHEKFKIEAIYFILYSKYGKFDKNLPKNSKQLKKIIRNIANTHKVGLHPSFQSNSNYTKLISEKTELEKLMERNIKQSRQHFLMLSLPETYENLIKIGIEEDFSMGYASQPGFRAGTCSPFYFFNLKTNAPTNLLVIPFAVMDVCFKEYLKCSPANTLKKIKKIISSIKKVNGLFVSLWHNENLTGTFNKIQTHSSSFSMLNIDNIKQTKNEEKLTNNDQELTWHHVYERMLNEANNRA